MRGGASLITDPRVHEYTPQYFSWGIHDVPTIFISELSFIETEYLVCQSSMKQQRPEGQAGVSISIKNKEDWEKKEKRKEVEAIALLILKNTI